MKKMIFFLIFVNIILLVYSQPNYANGNGTIIRVENIGNTTRTFRRHHQRIQIKEILYINGYPADNLFIYTNPEINNNEVINKLEYGDIINIEQILEINEGNNYFVWLNIYKNNGINGWFFCGENRQYSPRVCVPYYNNRWEILERISINNRIWTVRNLNNQRVSVWQIINMRDNPGLVDTNVISQIFPSNNSWTLFVEVIAATEEIETIEGKTDRWLKINHNGIEGWIFGGYVDVERGGVKYYIPEDMIYFHFTW